MTQPLCFVLMPFGQKRDPGGGTIDFDAVYDDLIRPAIEAADLDPVRADEEKTGGLIHKPMFERLVMCDFAVADLTTANANVFYELGVRHAVRPYSTVLLFAEGTRLPFDLGPMRAMPYSLGPAGTPERVDTDRDALTAALREARGAATDSPLFQLIDGMRAQEIDHKKTDVFRAQVDYSRDVKEQLADARKRGLEAVVEIDRSLGDVADVESGIVIDLFLSYRAVKGWEQMVELVERMARPLKRTVLVREQQAFALNRLGRGDEAERILTRLIDDRGPSSETYGLLGRIYKDRWDQARQAGEGFQARAELGKAIDAYLKGFEADWRDAYPGINAVTLMELADPPDERRAALLPVVTYAVERSIAGGEPDYWDYATLLELAVLASDADVAYDALAKSLGAVREPWEPETTARNLRLIAETRAGRGDAEEWLDEVIRELDKSSAALS